MSDLYAGPSDEDPNLELSCVQLSINPGYNEALKSKCPHLKGYMVYVEKVRKYAKMMSLEDAVERAIDECIAEGVLVEFLTKNRAAVISMNAFEITEEQFREVCFEDGYAVGHEKGREEGIRQQREKDETEIRELKEEIRRLRGEVV